MSNFNTAMEHVFKWEGVDSNDPADPGGKTRYGITLKTFRKLHPAGNFRMMDKEFAADIYREHYWQKAQCHLLPNWLSLPVFDCAVNQGPGRAIKFLQKTIKVKADGIWGPISTQTLFAQQGNRVELLEWFMTHRAMHYSSLPHMFRFGTGWYRRLFDTFHAATKLMESPDAG